MQAQNTELEDLKGASLSDAQQSASLRAELSTLKATTSRKAAQLEHFTREADALRAELAAAHALTQDLKSALAADASDEAAQRHADSLAQVCANAVTPYRSVFSCLSAGQTIRLENQIRTYIVSRVIASKMLLFWLELDRGAAALQI